MKGLKIKTTPIVYEIEISNIGGEIKEEEKEEFLDWLQSQVHTCCVGANYEYYINSDNQDIEVSFKIKAVK